MAECGWDDVTYLKKQKSKSGHLKTSQALSAAQRSGVAIETTAKFTASKNNQHSTNKDTAKLDRETEELHHDKLGLDVGKIIQQGRQDKKLTQKELATKVNEKPQVINDYEAGRAIPNNQVLGKLERALGIKLRGKDKGKALSQGPKKK